jgi:hypothetical protein
MAEAYPYEIRMDARGHYVISGMTYEQVAEVTGVSVSQLKKWGSDEGWVESRKKYREAQVSIGENTMLLRADLLKNALTTKDAQDVYAVAAMEKIAITLEKIRPAETGASSVPDMQFDDPEQMIDGLWSAIEARTAKMINAPETMDLKQIQAGIKTWCDLKRQYADKSKASGQKQKGFDADQVAIIEKLLEKF